MNYAFAAQGKPGDSLAVEQQSYESLLALSPWTADFSVTVSGERETELLERLLSAIYRGGPGADLPPS
jgi:hypothetical protein